MPESFIFDQAHARRFVAARQALLRNFLPPLQQALSLRTAADVGCGVGYFAGFLQEMGLQVVGVDGRRENIEEARRRNPDIEFHIADVEDSAVQKLGSFDLVLCFGLLYHLENPFRALRNFSALTGKVLLLETICIPGPQRVLHLRDEPDYEDQSLTSVAFYPSEECLIKMCSRAGLPFVYRFTSLPDHEDFRATLWRKRLRKMLAASKVPLETPALAPVQERPDTTDPWATHLVKLWQPIDRLIMFLRRSWSVRVDTSRERMSGD